MDYKVKLQNNNNVFKDNNTDLQAVLETINNLPAAGSGTEDLDAEITEQEGLIEQIEAALVGKASNTLKLCTVNYESKYGRLLNIEYMTIDDNDNIIYENINDTINGTINVIDGSYIHISTVEIKDDSIWGEEYYCPGISNVASSNSCPVFIHNMDNSMAVVNITYDNNLSILTDG